MEGQVDEGGGVCRGFFISMDGWKKADEERKEVLVGERWREVAGE